MLLWQRAVKNAMEGWSVVSVSMGLRSLSQWAGHQKEKLERKEISKQNPIQLTKICCWPFLPLTCIAHVTSKEQLVSFSTHHGNVWLWLVVAYISAMSQ